METYKISHGDKKIFVRYLNFLSQNIIRYDETYRLNFRLQDFDPYARNDQPSRSKLAEIVHAMGATIMPTRRAPIGRTVEISAKDVFFTHIRNLPDWVDLEIKNIEQETFREVGTSRDQGNLLLFLSFQQSVSDLSQSINH